MSIPEYAARYVRKEVYSMDEMPAFRQSIAFHWLFKFLRALSDAAIGQFNKPVQPPNPPFVDGLMKIIEQIDSLTDQVDIADRDAQRFGNKAFRQWHDSMVDLLPSMCEKFVKDYYKPYPGAHLLPLPPARSSESQSGDASTVESACSAASNGSESPGSHAHDVIAVHPEHLAGLLVGYLSDSFGNRTRIDYGTGHELAFIAVLCVLCRVGIATPSDLPFLVGVLRRYIEACRRFQRKYSLEPAGSHGSWGLDDYHIAPFVVGSAQHMVLACPTDTVKAKGPGGFTRRAMREAAEAAENTAAGNGAAGDGESSGASKTPAASEDGGEARAAAGGEDAQPKAASKDDSDGKGQSDSEGKEQDAKPCSGSTWDARAYEFSHRGDDDTPVNLMQSPASCRELAPRSLFFSMMDWIHSNKSGPFHEHSPTLYDISQITSWVVVRRGLLRMFGEEVLNVHTIIQHFRFSDVLSLSPMPEYARVDVAAPTGDTDASSAAAYKHARSQYTNTRAQVLTNAMRGGAMGMAGLGGGIGGAMGSHPAALGLAVGASTLASGMHPGAMGVGTMHPGAMGGVGTMHPGAMGAMMGVGTMHPGAIGTMHPGRGGGASGGAALPPHARRGQ